MNDTKGIIFDLDGVIVDTAKFHYLAWRKMANDLGFDITLELGQNFALLLYKTGRCAAGLLLFRRPFFQGRVGEAQ